MRMTREAYARQVWKAVDEAAIGDVEAECPHENCGERLRVRTSSLQAGTVVICPQHGVIYRV
ncbi:MAG: hypothetical protein ACYC2Y_11450 [Armatimonadota bacterium]